MVLRRKCNPSQPCGCRAEKFFDGFILIKIADIKGYGSDRYGRILAEIYTDDRNLDLEMVKSGYAEIVSWSPPRRPQPE
ncbi:MAG: thermonuclease family protein [bacterium]|nr:thermonuclease family protein [bacterium]